MRPSGEGGGGLGSALGAHALCWRRTTIWAGAVCKACVTCHLVLPPGAYQSHFGCTPWPAPPLPRLAGTAHRVLLPACTLAPRRLNFYCEYLLLPFLGA